MGRSRGSDRAARQPGGQAFPHRRRSRRIYANLGDKLYDEQCAFARGPGGATIMRKEEVMGRQVRVTIGPDVFIGIVIAVVYDLRDGPTDNGQSVNVRRLTLDTSDIYENVTPDQIEFVDTQTRTIPMALTTQVRP